MRSGGHVAAPGSRCTGETPALVFTWTTPEARLRGVKCWCRSSCHRLTVTFFFRRAGGVFCFCCAAGAATVAFPRVATTSPVKENGISSLVMVDALSLTIPSRVKVPW